MVNDHVILGIHVTDRLQRASEVQRIFTEYGCHIKTRLGLHEVSPDFCSPQGVVLLEMVGGPEVWQGMKAQLQGIEGIDVQEMIFRH
ncbi:MAG: hypothetical protein LWX11_09945 [Firmicutes bacterium]|nr:hypothetical protein [Bacillota bacterium]